MKAFRPTLAALGGLLAAAMLPSPAGAVVQGANGRIAFVSSRSGTRQIYAMRQDGDPTSAIQLTSTGNNYDPAWSGDGAKLAFISDRDGAPELYTMNADGSSPTRLTTNLGTIVESHPSWAPNNSGIAFAGLVSTGDSEIYSILPTGGPLTDLTNDSTDFDADPAWSPGGKTIAFDRTIPGGATDVYTIPQTGGTATQLTIDGKSSNPAWAPDNKTLTYESAKDNPTPGPVKFVSTPKKPVSIAVTSSKVLYTEWNTDNVKQVDSNGTISTFATLPPTQLAGERYLAISPGLGGFPTGDVYATVGPNVYQITPDGLTVTLCANVSGFPNAETGITFDSVGTFQNQMILTARTGLVHTVPWNAQTNSCGTPVHFHDFPDQAEGPLVAPLSFIPYPGWLLVGNEFQNVVFAMDPSTGAVSTISDPNGLLNTPEGTIQIPPTVCNLTGMNGAYFVAMKDMKQIVMFDASNFTGLNNDVLAPSEEAPNTAGIARLHSNGSSIDISTFWSNVGTAELEGSAFAPCGSGSPGRAHDAAVAGPHEIYRLNINAPLTQTRLTNNTTDDIDPAYSPDGLSIAFQSDRDNPGSGIYEIYKMVAADGTGQTNISNNLSANDTTPDWESASAVVSVCDFSFTPATAKPKQGGVVLWDFGPGGCAASDHTATDNTGNSPPLFDSGTKHPGGYYVFKFSWAASFPVVCTIHPTMTGTVKVPILAAPKSGNLTTTFTITWAAAKAPTGWNMDVQILRPGATDWADWKPNQTNYLSATFTADGGTGVYSFKARLQKGTGLATDYSTPVSITVNP